MLVLFALLSVAFAQTCEEPLPPNTYEYVFVGGGMASIGAAYWLSDALKKAGKTVSIAVIEKQSYLGGNVYDVPLTYPNGTDTIDPSKYDGSFGPLPLRAGIGALRITQFYLGLERRLAAQLNLTMFWSPFRNHINMRGVRAACDDPYEHAAGDLENVYAYGDFCNNRAPFVHIAGEDSITDEQAVFRGFDDLIPAEDDVNPGDPSSLAWYYLLQNTPFMTGESDMDQLNADGKYNSEFNYGGIQPFDGTKAVCEGTACPYTRATGRDWKTHVELELHKPNGPVLNQQYSKFMQNDNVGFHGDFDNGFSAKSYSEYNVYEFNTNSFNAYFPNGMSTLANAMVAAAKSRGVKFFTNEHVRVVKRASAAGQFDIVTNLRSVRAKKWVGLNLPRFYLFPNLDEDPIVQFDGKDLSGDVINDLRAIDEVKVPQAARSYKIVIQYKPGKRAWFWDLFANGTMEYSVRQYGDTGCTARIEFTDTPFHRCTNHITVVYTDSLCRRKWQVYVEEAERTGVQTTLLDRLHEEIQSAYPEYATAMEKPIAVHYRLFNSAWHIGRVGYDQFNTNDLIAKAQDPLDGEHVGLIGEAYFTWRSGWIEGALRSSKRFLERIAIAEGFASNLDATFTELFAILKDSDDKVGDSSPSPVGNGASRFGYMPVAFPEDERDTGMMLRNEVWPPFNDAVQPGYNQDSCRPELYGVKLQNNF